MEADYKDGSRDWGSVSFDDGSRCSYRIVRSDRRTMALQVKKNGEVLVRLPRRLPARAGHELVQKNKVWLSVQVKKIRESFEGREDFHWKEGAFLLLFGKQRILRVEPDFGRKGFLVRDTAEELIITGPADKNGGKGTEEMIKEVMERWYRQAARQYLEEKTARWAAKMNVSYGRIAIRGQVTRWGSCSGKGNLNFNWKLVLLPEELADYVVVHELSHRFHMDHSRAFWERVEKELPDYRLRRRKLKGWENEIYQKY
ncbi:SprT family zinc-dependent metalloprotease [Lachnospiraceae bacterium 54-53]